MSYEGLSGWGATWQYADYNLTNRISVHHTFYLHLWGWISSMNPVDVRDAIPAAALIEAHCEASQQIQVRPLGLWITTFGQSGQLREAELRLE